MAKKKKVDKPWGVDPKLVQQRAAASIAKTTQPKSVIEEAATSPPEKVEDIPVVKKVAKVETKQPKKSKLDFKFLKASIPHHLKLKLLSVKSGMKLKEYTEWLIDQEWERKGEKM